MKTKARKAGAGAKRGGSESDGRGQQGGKREGGGGSQPSSKQGQGQHSGKQGKEKK
jgi:hypothetical protein